MSNRVKRNASMLRLLASSKPGVVKSILRGASPDLVDTLSECSANLLKGNVPLTSVQKKRLCRHRQKLRILANRKTSTQRRKKVLQQGGFIGELIKPILGVLSGILGGL